MDSAVREKVPKGREYRFTPDVGRWQIKWRTLISAFEADSSEGLSDLREQVRETDNLLDSDEEVGCRDRLRYYFAVSTLNDIYQAGGSIEVRDSQLAVAWPDWSANEHGRTLAKRALDGLTSDDSLASSQVQELSSVFAPSLTGQELLDFAFNGDFSLVPVDDVHPSGIEYSEAFSIGLRYWNMPYRGREGRLRRFVLVGEQREKDRGPYVVGLLEIGDDAPYNTIRDNFLGLRPESVKKWLKNQSDVEATCQRIADHFRHLRASLRPIERVNTEADYELILEQYDRLSQRASGRSKSDKNLAEKKRIAYLLRFSHGERAFSEFPDGLSAEGWKSFGKGIRAIHNLVLPRIHMEATICGALPPLSLALGGKLVVAFTGDPKVVKIPMGKPGLILQDLFRTDDLQELIPNEGILGLTTKGLYPDHSPMYNRAFVVGAEENIRLRKIGTTAGVTTSLLRDRTVELAKALHSSSGSETRVSRAYGTGGAKRQRVLEGAAAETGLPTDVLHAGINRPIYGIRFIKNIMDVLWAGEDPVWHLDREMSSGEYAIATTTRWRERWEDTIKGRVDCEARYPGLLECLSG